MTNLQFKVAVEVNRFGSISKAAKELNISQPNISNYLKTLEEEIGFPIFNRIKSGVILTEKGKYFIENAKTILSLEDSIMSIQNITNKYRLKIGSVNYSLALEAFLKICEKHKDDKDAELNYYNISVSKGIMELINYNLDVIVVPILKTQVTSVKNLCKANNIEMISLGLKQAVIRLRKDHPAISLFKCQNIVQGSDLMKDYPYVSYRNLDEDNSPTAYNDSDYIQCSYKMYADGNDARLRIISSTNAFSFGIMLNKKILDKYNLASFPINGVYLEVYCLVRKQDNNRIEINDYLTIFKDVLNEE